MEDDIQGEGREGEGSRTSRVFLSHLLAAAAAAAAVAAAAAAAAVAAAVAAAATQ